MRCPVILVGVLASLALSDLAAASGLNDTASATSPASQEATAVPSQQRIETIQRALNRNGARLRVTGVWDAPTAAALRKFQRSHGLATTGGVDAPTAKELHLSGANG